MLTWAQVTRENPAGVLVHHCLPVQCVVGCVIWVCSVYDGVRHLCPPYYSRREVMNMKLKMYKNFRRDLVIMIGLIVLWFITRAC